MRKKIGLIILLLIFILFFAHATLSAQGEKSIRALVGGGYALADYEGVMGGLGLEMQFAPALFAQLSFDYYLNPLPDAEKVTNTSFTLSCIGLDGIYKVSPAPSFTLFAKAGLRMAGVRQKLDYNGVTVSRSDSRFGVGGGVGLEFALTERYGLQTLAEVIYLLDKPATHWFKLFVAVSYRIK